MPPGADKHARTWVVPLLLTLAAVAVRVAAMALPTPDADMAVIGLIALHALKGDFSAFFYGESNGGTIESLLAAPLLWLFGPSTEVLSLAPALFSLAFLWCAYLACADMWGRRAGLAAMAFAAAPPYFFAWHSVLPRGAYIETALFCLLLVWITHRLVHRGPTRRLYLLYGLVAGLGLWTHFMMIFALAASGTYILLANWRLLISRWLPWAVGGLLAGGLPLWLHNLTHGGDSFHFLLARKTGPGAWEVLRDFWVRGVPVVLGVTWDRPIALMIPYASWGVLALGLAALVWLVWLRRGGIAGLLRLSPARADGAELWLLLAFMVMAVMVVTGEPLGSTRRHLVPIYAALIPLAGYAFDQLHRRTRPAAWLLAGLALASNLTGILATSNLTNPALRQEAENRRREDFSIIKQMADLGIDRAYALDFWVAPLLTFLSGERLLVERPNIDLDHFYEPNQRAVGQTPGMVPFVARRDAPGVEEMLRAMGAQFKVLRDGPYACFHRLRSHVPGLRLLPEDGWRISASRHAGDAGLALDDDALTRWSPLRTQRPGESLTLDLGRVVEDLCLVRLSSGRADDQPAGLELATSSDGETWNAAAQMGAVPWPFHWDAGRPQTGPHDPRLDLGFSPRPARYLRLTQTGSSALAYWSVQQIRLYAAAPAPARPFDPAAAVAAAQALGARHLYADDHLAAFVPRRMRPPLVEPPANPAWPLDLNPRGTLPADLAGLALAVAEADAPGVRGFLAGRGVAHEETPAGGFAIFHHLRPPRALPAALRPEPAAAASSWPGGEAAAWDGRPATAWVTGRPRQAGDFLQVDLGRPMALEGLVLDNPAAPNDLARSVRLELSGDGQAWREVAWQATPEGPIYFAGDRLLGAQPGRLRLGFPAQEARHLRLSLTQGHEAFHWGVAELGLCPAEGGQARGPSRPGASSP